MADIFVSYASADREIARTLGEALIARGHDTWWDRTIPPGRVFDEVIQEALTAAKCVIVLWSQASIASNWVKTEAAEATGRNILVPVMIENALPPIEFKRIQSANLAAWTGDQNDPEFRNLLASVDRLLASGAKSPSAPAPKGAVNPGWGKQPSRPASSALYKWSVVAAVVLGLMGVGALWVYRLGLDAGKAPAAAENRGSQIAAAPRGQAEPASSTGPAAQKNAPAAAVGKRVNILLADNGGHLVAASNDGWTKTIDGKERFDRYLNAGESGVFAFKDERPATFDIFTVLISGTSGDNIKGFELFKGNDSPTGKFEFLGTFETQNLKLFKTPYQEFKFPPVTAKYFKVKIISFWSDISYGSIYQIQLLGTGP